MAESGLYDAPPGPAIQCPSCGRIVEAPIEVTDADGTRRQIRGHVQGDPALCVPLPTVAQLQERDARRRRAKRRGR